MGNIRQLLTRISENWCVAAMRILNWLVFSFNTTVRAIRDSFRDAAHACSASFRIMGSISVSKTFVALPVGRLPE